MQGLITKWNLSDETHITKFQSGIKFITCLTCFSNGTFISAGSGQTILSLLKKIMIEDF